MVPDAPELDPTNAVSVEAWVPLTSYPNTGGVLVVYKNVYFGPWQYAVSVYQTGSNSIFQALLEVVPSGNLAMYGTTSLQLNTWYHVAITYDRAQFKLYVNGQLENSAAVTGPLMTTTGPLKIGGYGVSPYGLPGQVDEASVYNRALTSAEVQAIYAAGSAPTSTWPPAISRAVSTESWLSRKRSGRSYLF